MKKMSKSKNSLKNLLKQMKVLFGKINIKVLKKLLLKKLIN